VHLRLTKGFVFRPWSGQGKSGKQASLGAFELLEHTADVGIIATGGSLAEALSWAARGMFSVIVELDDVAPLESLEVSVASPDQEALTVDWLNELLYRYEAEGFLPKEYLVSVDETGTNLTAQCLGEPFDPERHHILTSVKAATYHELMVTHNQEWQIRVILDV
jgi:SHS2 domain-containing protein